MAKKSTKGRDMLAPMADIDWRAKDALSTLTRAEEIKRDKPLMKAAKAEARKQAKALQKVCAPGAMNGKRK